MEKWSTIVRKEDGSRVEITTYLSSSLWDNYKIVWNQEVRVCGHRRSTWLKAKEVIDYTQEDLRNERLKYLENLKKEI